MEFLIIVICMILRFVTLARNQQAQEGNQPIKQHYQTRDSTDITGHGRSQTSTHPVSPFPTYAAQPSISRRSTSIYNRRISICTGYMSVIPETRVAPTGLDMNVGVAGVAAPAPKPVLLNRTTLASCTSLESAPRNERRGILETGGRLDTSPRLLISPTWCICCWLPLP